MNQQIDNYKFNYNLEFKPIQCPNIKRQTLQMLKFVILKNLQIAYYILQQLTKYTLPTRIVYTNKRKMIQQRKRFNYLSTQQRTLNAIGSVQTSITLSKNNSTKYPAQNKYQSDVKPQQYGSITQQNFNSNTRRSSIAKNGLLVEPLGESSLMMSNNKNTSNAFNPKMQSNQKPSQKKSLQSSKISTTIIKNKQNVFSSIPQTLLQKNPSKLSESTTKPYSYITPNPPFQQQQTVSCSSEQIYKQRIKQLQKQNQLLLKNQQQKYGEMFLHLQKVQNILKQKQSVIERLKGENQVLNQRQQQEEFEIQNRKQAEVQEQTIDLNSLKFSQQIAVQTQPDSEEPLINQQQKPQHHSYCCQTQLSSQYISQLIRKASQLQQQDPTKASYRQKYQSLFKKALQMQDQIYKLKQDLFDSQTEVKTLQQQFNTYKILNQIQKLNQKGE